MYAKVPMNTVYLFVKCQTPSKRRTNEETDGLRDASLFPLRLSGASISYGGTNRDASYKFKLGIKIRDKPINTRNLVS